MGIIDSIKKTTKGKSASTAKKSPVKKPVAGSDTDVKSQTVSSDAKKSIRLSKFSGVLSHPLVSEKAAHAEAMNVYTFVVARDTNKYAIKQAVKDIYGVMPEKVRVINYEGKSGRYGRFGGRRSDWKKAIVTLSKGQSIRIHEGV